MHFFFVCHTPCWQQPNIQRCLSNNFTFLSQSINHIGLSFRVCVCVFWKHPINKLSLTESLENPWNEIYKTFTGPNKVLPLFSSPLFKAQWVKLCHLVESLCHLLSHRLLRLPVMEVSNKHVEMVSTLLKPFALLVSKTRNMNYLLEPR